MDFHCLKKNKWFNKFNEWFYPSGSTIKNKIINLQRTLTANWWSRRE